jgi:DNA-binding SARP family transcriptional activator
LRQENRNAAPSNPVKRAQPASQPASQVLQSLEALWVRVTVALAEARLAAGDHAALVPDLEQAVADHPLDEQLHAPLMLALYRAGRQAEALACYRRLHRALDAELGVAPARRCATSKRPSCARTGPSSFPRRP